MVNVNSLDIFRLLSQATGFHPSKAPFPIMIAEVISIGDELTSGQRLDTNSQWISQQLGDLGIRVMYHTTVGDSEDANIRVFRAAFERANIVICTGGLGPTADDLTRQVIAATLGVGLYRDQESLDHIRSLFARRNRVMPAQNEIQADFPEGSFPIFNPEGSAPGIVYQDSDSRTDSDHPLLLMAFPGVPAELKEMFKGFAIGRLLDFLGAKRKFLKHKAIRCFGMGESQLEAELPDLIKRGNDPLVGITASSATISLRISAHGVSEDDCDRKISETEARIRECLGELVFGTEDQELQHVLYEMLSDRQQTLALAEVGTGGYLSHLFSEVDREGKVFVGSYIARNNDRLEKFLGQPFDFPNDFSKTGKLLAEKCQEFYESDYAIAIDAFPDNDADPLQIGIATPDSTMGIKRPFGGHPSIHLPRAAKQAMNELRLWLLRHEV